MLKDAKSIVFKVGTSTLTHKSGKLNLRRLEELVQVLADLMNAGIRVTLVTSGAIGVGMGKLGLRERPADTAGKQAAATVGQCELMYIYDKLFAQYGYNVGQLLITRADVEDPQRHDNLVQTFRQLEAMGVLPIINENDAVAVEEIVYGDNDSLSAVVAALIRADALVILTETDGLYTANPAVDPSARRIPLVREITEEVKACAGGAVSGLGTGGMVTKVHAAEIAANAGIDTYVLNGADPKAIYRLRDGEDLGTRVLGKERG